MITIDIYNDYKLEFLRKLINFMEINEVSYFLLKRNGKVLLAPIEVEIPTLRNE